MVTVFAVAEGLTHAPVVTRYGPGTEPPAWRPGDFILVHGEGLLSGLIRTAQRLSLRGEEKRFAVWDHCALVVTEDGDLVEAIGGQGIISSHASRYLWREYRLVRPPADEAARRSAVQFATWALENRPGYGWLVILSLVLQHGLNGRLAFHLAGQEICSSLVARALERSGVLLVSTPSHVMPADLARFFGVEPPNAAALL